ncbi:hypothetical protein [Dyella terrae]|nr:hypothetical protein [Dyella terrae]
MTNDSRPTLTHGCDALCAQPASMDDLNRDCHCVAVPAESMHTALASAMGAHGLPQAIAQTHPNLFASLPVFLSRQHLDAMARVVGDIESAVSQPAYRAMALSWAPPIAGFDPGAAGGMLGLDFHITPDGPRLIEINTNPGGALLNALVGQALRVCVPDTLAIPTDMSGVEQRVLQIMRQEWHSQAGERPLTSIAIVDEDPTQQYLYPEFLLFRELFIRHGIDAAICDPSELIHQDGRLWLHGQPVDLIYNRLTDFSLSERAHAAMRASYLAGETVVTPHPRAHALYADKRNLALLGDAEFLRTSGATESTIATLAAAVPTTMLVTDHNRDDLWSRRRDMFFKPASGFGSKASYRGDKLTRRVWDEIRTSTYIAQALVPPDRRHTHRDDAPLKSDIRAYAYRGEVFLYAARLYQGQTTNFRTPGGGFAPVLTSKV